MTISSEIKKELKLNSDNNKLEFQNLTEIYFPHICIICRNHADKHVVKNLHGLYATNKDYKKNYNFSLPVCDSCKNNIEMKTGLSSKSGKMLLISFILGTIIAILLFLTLYSFLLSISIFAISIIFPARNYKIKTKSKIRFDNHVKIRINPKNPDIVELELSDKEFARALEEINLSQIKLKKEQEDKKQQQKLLDSTEPEQINENIEPEKSPVEITITKPVSRENNIKEQIPDSTESQPINKNIENEKSPVKITIHEPLSGENNNKEQKFFCPKCKVEIKSEWVFCDNCGTPINK